MCPKGRHLNLGELSLVCESARERHIQQGLDDIQAAGFAITVMLTLCHTELTVMNKAGSKFHHGLQGEDPGH